MLLVVGVAHPAGAAPTPSISTVGAQVEALQQQTEQATEKYNQMAEQLKSLQVRAAAARQRQAAQQHQVDLARQALGRLAAETYKAGDLSTLSLVLGDDPDAWLAQNGVVDTLDARASDAVGRLTAEQQKLQAVSADVAAQQQRITAASAAQQAAKRAIVRQLSAAQALLLRLKLTQRNALTQVSRGSERQQLQDILGPSVKIPSSGLVTCDDVGIDGTTARTAKVIAYACAHLGDRYVWAAAGPNTFDCSGLSMQAWARAGVSLPHNAAMQASMGTRVSAANLQPGDVLFYHAGITHDGIYIGRGLMIHAPHTGDVVRIAPVRYNELVAASRY